MSGLQCRNPRSVPVIGLTGTIGAGKSQVAALLAVRGAVVIDADAVGHEVLDLPEVQKQVVNRFGRDVLKPAAEEEPPLFAAIRAGQTDDSPPAVINRRALGAIVFADPQSRRDLEAMVHPEMRRRFERTIAEIEARADVPAIVLDAAVLLEAGWDDLCDIVALVDAPRPVRLERVARGRGWTDEILRSREASQWSVEEKRPRSHLWLCNDRTLEKLDLQVDYLLKIATNPEPPVAAAASDVPSSLIDCYVSAPLPPGAS